MNKSVIRKRTHGKLKPFAMVLFVLLESSVVIAQNEPWIRFLDTATGLSGYRDLNGNIKVPAKFGGFTRADSFYNIIAVTEEINDTYNYYHLLKDGRKVGNDSTFTSDYTFDCESEGKIIFYDRKTDRMGFLNSDGIAVIPADYNYVTPFRNGISAVLKNARKKCWGEGEDSVHCEHLSWQGGKLMLINDRNEILVDSVTIDLQDINWYSMTTNVPADTSVYISMPGINGRKYWFMDYAKEFNKWFYGEFLPATKHKDQLEKMLFNKITFWTNKEGWKALDKRSFLKTYPYELTAKRFEPGKLKDISISSDNMNTLIFNNGSYKQYLDACGEHNGHVFPLFDVMLTYRKPPGNKDTSGSGYLEIDFQEHFEFLRTEEGYRLISSNVSF